MINALVLGLIGGIIPGPVLMAVFSEIVARGYLKCFKVIFQALLLESLVALFSLTLVIFFDFNLDFFYVLSLVGSIVLIWMGIQIFNIKCINLDEQVFFTLPKIFILILSNGVLWIFWITVCVPKAILISEKIQFGEYLYLGMVELGWLSSTVLLAAIFAKFRSFLFSMAADWRTSRNYL